MAKKIHPKDQTEELNRVKLEFLKRNPGEWQKLEELLQGNDKKRGEFLDNLGGLCNAESRDAWDFLLREKIFDKELEDSIKEIEIPPAVNSTYPFMQFGIDVGKLAMMGKGEYLLQMSEDTKKKKFLDYLCQHALEIFTELTNGGEPATLLVGVDCRRGKEVILAEIENIPMIQNLNQLKQMTAKAPEKRLKWLATADEYIKVWDLRLEGKSFAEIKDLLKKDSLKIELDTIKKGFQRIFPFITNKDYSKGVWKDLVRDRLGYIATTEMPTDKKFWNQVKKIESTSQKDLTPGSTFFESKGNDDEQYNRSLLVADLKNICLSCSDTACRAITLKCLSEFDAGGMEAFEDFQPDCPKFYNYLKQ